MTHRLLVSAALLTAVGCGIERAYPPPIQTAGEASAIAAYPVHADFGDYWYQGKAEITSYNLEQPRYGETRPGKSVLIFVTEGFSRTKHVKLDDYASAGNDNITVLKLNRTRNFTTGIYPYSMMSSVFTPVSGNRNPHSLKVTTSSQEWCGHTFVQFDLEGNTFRVQHHSYFESNADQTVDLGRAILEDEIWTKIRINPAVLPVGEIQVIAGTLYQRLSHNAYTVERARASLEPVGDHESAYTLSYENRNRVLTIRFEADFPHRISGWEETYGSADSPVTTRATRDKSMLLDYWTRNSLADAALRTELNLD